MSRTATMERRRLGGRTAAVPAATLIHSFEHAAEDGGDTAGETPALLGMLRS